MKTVALTIIGFCLTAVLFITLTYSGDSPVSSPVSPTPAPGSTPFPAALRIEVRSVLDKPIPAVKVAIYRLSGREEEECVPCGERAEKITMEAVSPTVFEKELAPGVYRIEVTGVGWIGAREEGIKLQEGEFRELEFKLEPGAVISGQIIDSNGRPVPAVTVRYWSSGSESSPWFFSMDRESTTDLSGRFSFRSLRPGVYSLQIKGEGFVSNRVESVATGTTDLRVILKKGFVIRGKITGDVAGLKSPVRIELQRGRWDKSSRKAELDADNNFALTDLEKAIYSVRLNENGYISDWVSGVEAVSPGNARPITLSVFPGASLSGRVVDAGTGSPLAGIDIRLFPSGSKRGEYKSTDEDGKYEFRGLEAGEYILKAKFWYDPYSDYRIEKKVEITAGKEVSAGDLKLESGRRVTFSGLVTDEEGSAVERAEIKVRFRLPGEKSYRQNYQQDASSDLAGRFSVSVLLEEEGEVLITAGKAGYAPITQKIEITPERDSVSGLFLVLDYGVTLQVDVEEEGPNPETIPGAVVTLRNRRSKKREFTSWVHLKKLTDARGSCRFENLAPGAYKFEVSKTGYSPVTGKVELEEDVLKNNVSVSLNPGRTLRVRVENADGVPIGGAEITAREKTRKVVFSSFRLENITGDDGVCLIRDLPAAPLWLSVRAEGFADIHRRQVPVDRDEITVKLQTAGSIRGLFVRSGDEPVSELNLFPRKQKSGIFDFEPYIYLSQNTIELGGGEYKIINLSPGIYDLTVRAEAAAARKIEGVEVAAGEVTDLGKVKLVPESVITGRVLDRSQDTPLKGAWVRVKGRGLNLPALISSSGVTGSDGKFEVDGLEPGSYRLAVAATNFRPKTISAVSLGSGEKKRLSDIFLEKMSTEEREALKERRRIVPSLGVKLQERKEDGPDPVPDSLLIDEVLPSSAAEKGGLKAGDSIKKIDGKSLADDPLGFMKGLLGKPGTEIKVTVEREGGREEVVEITIDEWDAEELFSQMSGLD